MPGPTSLRPKRGVLLAPPPVAPGVGVPGVDVLQRGIASKRSWTGASSPSHPAMFQPGCRSVVTAPLPASADGPAGSPSCSVAEAGDGVDASDARRTATSRSAASGRGTRLAGMPPPRVSTSRSGRPSRHHTRRGAGGPTVTAPGAGSRGGRWARAGGPLVRLPGNRVGPGRVLPHGEQERRAGAGVLHRRSGGVHPWSRAAPQARRVRPALGSGGILHLNQRRGDHTCGARTDGPVECRGRPPREARQHPWP